MKQPMLAATLTDPKSLRFPVLVSPKIDGIRCLIIDGVAHTRKLKLVPNRYVRECLKGLPPLDGELITPGGTFNGAQSAFMSEDGKPMFFFYVFDCFASPGSPFSERYSQAVKHVKANQWRNCVRIVTHQLIADVRSFVVQEKVYVDGGAEGIMIRSLVGPYKAGRSTEREGWLLKYKRFATDEAEVIGFEEQMHNGNTKKRDETGHSKRSTAKAGLSPKGTLGKLIVRQQIGGKWIEFGIGTGFDDELRARIWRNREDYYGKFVTYKHQPHGAQEAPRFPVFVGFRDERDM